MEDLIKDYDLYNLFEKNCICVAFSSYTDDQIGKAKRLEQAEYLKYSHTEYDGRFARVVYIPTRKACELVHSLNQVKSEPK